ncbi:MAG: TIM barrel protein [Lautropia sp.]|nr:TIM barrel protein [Lautropia sp.]
MRREAMMARRWTNGPAGERLAVSRRAAIRASMPGSSERQRKTGRDDASPGRVRLGLTNIGWEPKDDTVVAALMQRFGIDALDVAPSRYFADPEQTTDQAVDQVRRWWAERGIEIVGMQSLLFDAPAGMNLFGPPAVQQAMLDRLAAVCRIGAGLGARNLVFGSLRHRDRRGLSDVEAHEMALDFFRRLADIALQAGVTICLEGVGTYYGANYLTDTASSAALVRELNHPACALHLDTVTLHLNHEDIEGLLALHADRIAHVHACEIDLRPLGSVDGERAVPHASMGAAIRRYLPGRVVCLEVLTPAGQRPVDVLERSIRLARIHYAR